MKKSIFLWAIMLSLFAFIACEKDEDKIMVLENPVASNLSALPSFANFNLDNAAGQLTFTWSAADFGYQSATTYILQVDSATKNFSNPFEIFRTTELTKTITVGDFNKALQDAGFEDYDVNHSLQLRIVAEISGTREKISAYSDALALTVAPYATSFPPIYMCGAATGGWDWTKGVEVRSSAPKIYSTIAYFLNGETFRFFAQADWGPTSYNYPYFTTVDSDLENANDGDLNFRVVGATGYYEIICDLKAKTVVMNPVPEPKMYMTGAAVGGWNWSTDYVQMTWKSNGVFEATTDFIANETFRFFAQADWGPTSYNYPYFDGGSVTPLLINAEDGDKNFKFVGTTGDYKIKLNLLDKVVTMTATK